MPRQAWVSWFRIRKGIRRRLFFAFGGAIALSFGVVSLVHRMTGRGAIHGPFGATCAVLVSFFFLWAFAGFVSARIAFPIVRLVGVVREFGEGALDRRAHVGSRAPAEVRELGDAFDAMAERITKQIDGQRELLATVSHELRTPLARLRLVLELARERGADVRFYGEAEAEIAALDELVASLLASSRLDAGAVSMAEADLVGLARDAVVRASESDEARSHALEAEADVVRVKVDVGLVVRAIAILLDNATRHGGPNVVVRVRSSGALEVEDDGPGIPEAERPRVFSPFVRGEGKAFDERRGVGLGLYLVRRIAEAHHTDVRVESGGTGGARIVLGPFERTD